MIVTSRSAVSAYLQCARKRYWQYEAPNGTGTPGWERRALAIPLVTGIYVHRGLEAALRGSVPTEAAMMAKSAYLVECAERSLAVEEGSDVASVIEEQAAHVEALVLAWCRVRLPKWLAEYDVVEVEAEDRVPLAEDVTLAVRADAIVRRKLDGRMFVVNFKTVGQADDRWLRAWEVDMQLMTELLAAERRHGGVFGGVIIEGLVKGRRMPEKNNVGDVIGYRDSSPLLYGYKVDADPPLVHGEYGWEYTRRKGWYRFPVWKEQFSHIPGTIATFMTPGFRDALERTTSPVSALEYWINWLPEEVVEAQFVTVPPIMRDEERIASCVRQIVAAEHTIACGIENIANSGDFSYTLNESFLQNTHACIYPSKCPMYDICWSPGVAADVAGSGLYVARQDHHAVEGGE